MSAYVWLCYCGSSFIKDFKYDIWKSDKSKLFWNAIRFNVTLSTNQENETLILNWLFTLKSAALINRIFNDLNQTNVIF